MVLRLWASGPNGLTGDSLWSFPLNILQHSRPWATGPCRVKLQVGKDNVHEVSVGLFAAHSLCLECILPAPIPPLCLRHSPTAYTDSHFSLHFIYACRKTDICYSKSLKDNDTIPIKNQFKNSWVRAGNTGRKDSHAPEEAGTQQWLSVVPEMLQDTAKKGSSTAI